MFLLNDFLRKKCGCPLFVSGPIEAPFKRPVLIRHTGKLGEEDSPFGSLVFTLDEGEKVEILKIDVYVFDLCSLVLKPMIVHGGDGTDFSQGSWARWHEQLPLSASIWRNQSAITYTASDPISIIHPTMRYLTSSNQRTLERRYPIEKNGPIVVIVSERVFEAEVIEDSDVVGTGLIGKPRVYLGFSNGKNTYLTLAHELGHTNGLRHADPLHTENDLMTGSGPKVPNITLNDTKVARKLALSYVVEK